MYFMISRTYYARVCEKRGKTMKKAVCTLLAGVFLLPAAACAQPVEPDLSDYASGMAEIPVEILGELDEETLADLVEEPKYVALTFDDGPREDTTTRLLDGLLERGAAATFFVIGHRITASTCSAVFSDSAMQIKLSLTVNAFSAVTPPAMADRLARAIREIALFFA